MAKKKTRAKKIHNMQLLAAKNSVRGSRNRLYSISEARLSLNEGNLRAFARWIASSENSEIKKSIFFPRRINNANKEGVLKPVNERSMTAWYTGLFEGYRSQISEFVKIKSRMNYLFQNSNFEKILEELDIFDKNFGETLWSIKLRIALIANLRGLEAQKNYVQSILDMQPNGFIRFIVYYLSVRAEEKMAAPRFFQLIEHIIQSAELDEEAVSFAQYHVLGNIDASKSVESKFYFASVLPIIDQYEYLVNYLIELQTERLDIGSWVGTVRTVCESVKDHRLDKLLAANIENYSFSQSFAKPNFDVRRSALKGDLSIVESIENSEIEDVYELNKFFVDRAKNKILSKSDSKIHLPGSEGEDQAIKLFKYGLLFDSIESGAWMKCVSAKHIFDQRDTENKFEIKRFFLNNIVDVYGLYGGKVLSRNVLKALGSEKESICWLWHSYISGVDQSPSVRGKISAEVSSANSRYIEIVESWRKGEYENVVRSAQKLIGSEEFLNPAAIMSFLILSRIKLEEYSLAVIDIVDFYFFRFDIARSLPFEELNEAISKEIRSKISGFIELPLFYNILVDIFNVDVGSLRSYSSEDFLISKQVKRPSENIKIFDGIDKKKVVYYLKNICTQDVMQFLFYFKKSKELEDERVRVCNMLVELDSKNSNVYESELRDLVRNSHIQSAIKQLRQSKISIDENEIRKWATENLSQDFYRLKDLIESGQKITSEGFKETLLNALKGDAVEPSIFDVPENESAQLLQDLITSFVRESYTNQEHGLDCYLSMRIRHGTLSGQLRNPIEEEFLITKRSSDDGRYNENEFWRHRLESRLAEDDILQVLSGLEKFSKEIDEKIDYITDQLIQIKGPRKERGLFAPVIPTANIMGLAYDVESGISFDDFVQSCLQVFWIVVETDLKRLRSFFSSEVKVDFKEIFVSLESEVEQYSSDEVLLNLKDASKLCFTKLSSSLDRVSEWFELPKPATDITFGIDELIEVGLESVKALHSDFEPYIQRDVSEIPRLQNALNLFSDMFFIIFENIYKHSGASTSPRVWVSSELDDNSIITRVENELDFSPDEKERTLEKLVDIKDRLYGQEYRQALRKEGGTGFFKLRKLIEADGSEVAGLDFGIEGGNFFVTVRNHVSILESEEAA